MSAVRKAAAGSVSREVRDLLEALPMPIAIVGQDGTVLHANKAMLAEAAGADPAQVPNAQQAQTAIGRCVFVPPPAAPDPQMQRLASLGFMLAGVCHEVSNPLAAIHSMVQILQSRRGVTRETLHKGLDAIAGNVVRVLGITRKLGDFSRVTGDAPQPQGVDAAVREALSLLRHNRWGESIQVDYEGSPEAITRAPSGDLQQVLFNLMLNAAQAMQGRGRMEISTALVDAALIRIRVRDYGPGIPEENLSRIFEPFFTTKPPGEGTGLGLAICNEIVHELGGSLSAQNAGDGAAMEVLLPLVR